MWFHSNFHHNFSFLLRPFVRIISKYKLRNSLCSSDPFYSTFLYRRRWCFFRAFFFSFLNGAERGETSFGPLRFFVCFPRDDGTQGQDAEAHGEGDRRQDESREGANGAAGGGASMLAARMNKMKLGKVT